MTSTFSSEELEDSRLSLLLISQQESFQDAISFLRKGKSLPSSNSLSPLVPILDEFSVLRVGGRLHKMDLSSHTQHPVILKATSPLCNLFVRHTHVQANHAGPSSMLAIISEKYYITGVKCLCKKISRECVICRKARARPSPELMGQLPGSCAVVAPPFTVCGIDFAGPFTTKRGNPRRPTHVKSYACVFICFSTKAVHIEPYSELSADAFLAAFSRFCAIRGTPADVHSDNGLNFVGAARHMSETQQLFKDSDLQHKVSHVSANQEIRSHFSPSRAPHFGGLWEAAVRNMKAVLKKILSPQILTFEKLATVFAEECYCQQSAPSAV